MTATLIKTLDNGWPTYSLRRADGRMIATTRFPFDEPALMIAKNAGINLQKLSHVKCDEIFGVIDVEKLAEEDAKFRENFVIESSQVAPYRLGFRNGCNKAMELNKDKVFTEKDVVEILNLYSKHVQINFSPKGIIQEPIDFIKSLQQSKEIEVEIEMDILNEYDQPKLDANGCLILKQQEQ